MKIELNEILYAVSQGLDAVEIELRDEKNNHCNGKHLTEGHCKRLAALSIMLGKALGLTADELIDLAAFSILHDNALTQVNQEENIGKPENFLIRPAGFSRKQRCIEKNRRYFGYISQLQCNRPDGNPGTGSIAVRIVSFEKKNDINKSCQDHQYIRNPAFFQ